MVVVVGCVCGVWGVGEGRGLAWGSGAWPVALWCHLGGWWGRVGAWELVHVPLALALVGLWCVVWWCVWWWWGGLGLVWFWFVCGGAGGWLWLMCVLVGSMGDGHVCLCGVWDVVCVGGGWGGV